MKIYLASPFFNETELAAVERAEQILRGRGFELFSPREHEMRDADPGSRAWAEAIFAMDRDAIDACDRMVVLNHGGYGDTGTAWECGYAYAKGIPAVIVHIGEDANLMVTEGSAANITLKDLEGYDFAAMPESPYQGSMF